MRIPLLLNNNPALSLNFMGGALPSQVTFSRSSSAWYFNSSGLLVQASSNAPRFDYNPSTLALNGLLIEGQSTNLALQSRDLTQAAWTKTSATAAKDQTGIDGVANSASSLTATANGGTCLQSIAQSSTNDTFSVYIKRITGTGTVKITLDGGTTYTDVTSSLSLSAWFRASATETVTNPSIGIQLGTSGDKIAVDVAQLEAQAFASSPIITTSATVTRAADVASVSIGGIIPANPSGLTILGKYVLGPPGIQNAAGPFRFFDLNDGTVNNRLFVNLASGEIDTLVDAAGSAQLNATLQPPTVTPDAVTRLWMSLSASKANAQVIGQALQSSAGSITMPTGLSTLGLGNYSSSNFFNGWLQKFIVYNRQISNAAALAASL